MVITYLYSSNYKGTKVFAVKNLDTHSVPKVTLFMHLENLYSILMLSFQQHSRSNFIYAIKLEFIVEENTAFK